jgi:GH24 family phage-related lysozyme (muramidase)
MNTSQQGLRALMKSEAFRAEAYQDSVGKWTIGYGTIKLDGKPVQKGQRITQERAAGALAEFCTGMEAALNTALRGVDTKQAHLPSVYTLKVINVQQLMQSFCGIKAQSMVLNKLLMA